MEPLADCSLVVAPYEIDGETAGSLGVLGAPRRDYSQALATVAVVGRRLGARLPEGLPLTDGLVLALALTNETVGIISAAELMALPRHAWRVNVARGGVVDTDALTEALAEGSIYHAGLDVTDPEPLPRDHPMLGLENVTIAPHLGSATEQTRQQMAEISVENLLLGLGGDPLRVRVT